MSTEKKIMISTLTIAVIVSFIFIGGFLKDEKLPEIIDYSDTYEIYKFLTTQSF